MCLVVLKIPPDVRGYVQRYELRSDDPGKNLMWSSRARSRDDDERYRKRTTDRLRGVGATRRVDDDDADQVRKRLERMSYGANRRPRQSESPA